MKLPQLILMCTFLLLSGISLTTTAEEIDYYKLSVDDKISVSIFNEPELGIENVKISTSGTISMPLIGQIKVKNLTVTQVESILVSQYLKGYLKKPNVTVTIVEYRPFYIDGEVKNPGSYPYRKGLTIQKAVTLAGGFTARAAKGAISIKSETDLNNAVSTSSAILTTKVKPGDVITVSESFF